VKKLLLLSLALATLAGCADADYYHTASNTSTTFKMVKPKPVNGNFRGNSVHRIDSVHRIHSASLAANSAQQA
jgi:hypothetical protein